MIYVGASNQSELFKIQENQNDIHEPSSKLSHQNQNTSESATLGETSGNTDMKKRGRGTKSRPN